MHRTLGLQASTFVFLIFSAGLLRGNDLRPNILWLTVEDLSPRLGCYGDDTVATPNIDRLARQGVRYTHAFTASGVCAPCRHTIITGVYPMESGAQYMRTGSRSSAINEIADPQRREQALQRPLYEATPPPNVRCFPELLRAAGYYCTNNSKTDYQFKPPLTVWDESSKKAHYRNRKTGQPFFAVFNHTVTHESGVHGQGRSPQRTDPALVRVPSFLPDTPVVRADIARHYDNIIALDQWVGEMLDELEAEGLADSTYVFFFSDHGDGLPRHKRWVYDSGTHVPLMVRYPDGRQSGTTDNSLVSFVDHAPTILSLAGVARPDYLRGRVYAGPATEAGPKFVFMHRDRMDDTSFETIRSVRGPRFRYVRNYRPDLPYLQPLAYRDRAATMGEIYRLREAGELRPLHWQWAAEAKPLEELYDCEADPAQVVNLAADPAYAATLQEMRAALEMWVTETNDPLAMNELEVIRTRVWPPEGQQPTTAAPQVTVRPLGDAGDRELAIHCETEGASLGYRTEKHGPWSVYVEPLNVAELPEGTRTIQVLSHRIGWKPSKKWIAF